MKNESWDQFAASGCVQDYLRFKQAAGDGSNTKEIADATQYPGAGATGHENGRM